MKTAFAIVGLATALVSSRVLAQGTVIYDQQSYSGLPSNDTLAAITTGQPMGQSFTPSLQAVGWINLALTPGLAGTGTVYIDIHSGSITGPIIGTSESVAVPISFFGALTFNFDSPVPVTPGTSYYFQPVVAPGGSDVRTPIIAPSIYAGGTAYYNGNPLPADDLEFQEGIYVPEPSTWALLAAGLGVLIWSRRR